MKILLKAIDEEQRRLNEQGYFTLIECTNFEKELYKIKIFQKNK